jgi:AraC family transcriptional regulator of adaptative response/methylated-DNA-[protein]-cysteine methyltransferase
MRGAAKGVECCQAQPLEPRPMQDMPRPVETFASDDARWNAVLTRESSAADAFYYCVVSTGIYCRPACPARLPKRANVRFHATIEEAEAAGFRPCRRCCPNAPALAVRRKAQIEHACRLIETAEDMPSLASLAHSLGTSPYHFHRLFKAATGVTPKAYGAAQRQIRLCEKLRTSKSVTQAVYDSGFTSSSRFYAESARVLGMSPKAFRDGGAEEDISFAVGECGLGSILVAASVRGVCTIALGDEPDALVRDLQDKFPRARLNGGDARFETMVAEIIGFVEASNRGLDLPLDIRGTAFQHRVWAALRDVTPGSTISYSELAKRIGRPNAARGVAGACAANAIAVAIPCHRVVRSDGALSGYRWGVERKRELLARERKS